jgi:L-threonate 2-dehydrogenase
MAETIAVIAPGEMGAGVGGRLIAGGATVITSLVGRSALSAARAQRSGMAPVESDEDLVARASFILSIVPPGDAVALAERLRPALARAARKPVYVDCNAVAPETVKRIDAIVAPTGCPFVDAGIIGLPPSGSGPGPKFYASGPQARAFAALIPFGLQVRVIEGEIGAASALKMSYAGITKGLTAIGSAMMLGATRSGAADALRQELSESQPMLLEWLARSVPRMFPKAYRWVAEMEEIAAFLGDPAAGQIYRGMARLYAAVAEQADSSDPTNAKDLAGLTEFCNAVTEQTARKRA